MRYLWLAVLSSAAFGAHAAQAPPTAAVTQCDLLASHPEDPDLIAPGVPSSKVDVPKAIAACADEVARQPANMRVRYQYARALAYGGETKQAAEHMKIAADGGHRQAQFVYGLFIDRGRAHAPSDLCLAEQYFLKSARAGRQAGRLIYVHHVLNGRFDACRPRASSADLRQLLDAAATDAGEFYERLLIDVLERQLAARSSL